MIWNSWGETPLEVLLIEDDSLETGMLYDYLHGTRITMWREARLTAALENLKEHKYDLILLDSTLPDSEEMESLQRVRLAAPNTPVLMMGQLASDVMARDFLRAGAQDYLLKPDLTRTSLLRALTYAVERHSLQREADALRTKAEALARRKEQFAAMVSHEILNPMSGMLGFARLMGKTELNPKQREYLGVISECTQSLSELVTDLLELSRLEEGRETARRETFSLLELAEELATFLGNGETPEAVRLLLVCDPTLPSKVLGDRVKVRQILYNLLQNAMKFTETGHVALRIKLQGSDHSGVRVRLMVEDSGRGIPEGKRHQIFEPFSQVTGKDRRRGHGLGLAICAQLARVMGSELKVLSEVGQGTIFWMDLTLGHSSEADLPRRILGGKRALVVSDYEPERMAGIEMLDALGALVCDAAPGFFPAGAFDILVVSERDPRCNEILAASAGKVDRRVLVARQVEAASPPDEDVEVVASPLRLSHLTVSARAKKSKVEDSGTAGRALVVEDDPVCRVYLTHLLGNLGYRVDTAGDDQEAFHHVSRRRYKVVTLDGHLPGADGPTVYRTMQAQGWLSPETQVLIVSGDEDLWRNSVRAGDSHVHLVGKPVCPDTVASLLNSASEPPFDLSVDGGWDEERVRTLEALGPDAARTLFETFGRSVPEVLTALDQAVQNGDPLSIRKLSHQVKGAAASVGARGLAHCAGALETAAQEGSGQWEHLLFAIHKEFQRSTDDMRARQQQHSGVIS